MPSTIIHKKCPTCGKLAQVDRERKIAGLKFITYTCGHIVTEKIIKETDFYKTCVSSLGHTPYQYQVDGMHFLERSNFRAHLGDEMGLGKTLQFLLPIKAHPELLTPYVLCCKSGLKIQMLKAILEWLGDDYMPQVIDSARDYIIPGAKGYIFSYDILRRFRSNGKSAKTADLEDFELKPDAKAEPDPLEALMLRLGIKYVILDECQLIKNSESQRTGAVRLVCKNADHVVSASGTFIKNHFGEAFPILNVLRPDKFPKKSSFDYQWVDTYWDGYKYKYGGVRYPERFRDYTQDFILRRTRSEVLPDLPQVTRMFSFHELGAEVEEMYANKYKQFQDEYLYGEGSSFEKFSNLMGYLAEMRHITAMAKIDPCLDFVTDFLIDNTRKITIFVHHIDIATSLEAKINEMLREGGFGFKCLRLEGGMDAVKKDEIVTSFMDGDARVLIASTLASGEGLNLQKCSDCIMLERQWNPANEEQAECRFIRIGQLSDKVNATYLIAVGTVDEFLSELVERKRAIMKQSLDNDTSAKWNETDLMRELMEILVAKGGKKWGW